MKLALVFVAAALSLAACAEQPTNPGDGLSGIGPSKQFSTDPTLIDVRPERGDHRADLDSWVEIVNDDYSALHYMQETIELVDLVKADGSFVCHYSKGGVVLDDCGKL